MRGLRIIPAFLLLVVLSFVGAVFVVQNNDPVSVRFFAYEVPPTKLGLIVLTSILTGMVIAALFCSVELLSLYVQNRRLRRKISQLKPTPPPPTETSFHDRGSESSGVHSM